MSLVDEQNVEDSDDRLSQVCQASLFFSLASGIILKLEVDSSQTVLSYLLTVMLAVPPVLAFVFESDVDFETLGASYLKRAAWACFAPVGRFFERCFKASRRRESRVEAAGLNLGPEAGTAAMKMVEQQDHVEQRL